MPRSSIVSACAAGIRKPAVLAVGAAAGLALGSFGVAAAQPSPVSTSALSQIKVCVSKSNGRIRYLKQSMDDCKDGEALLRWNTKGADGEDGVDGRDGEDGAAGATIRSGGGAPAAGVGADGDFYLDTNSAILYGPKAAGAWPISGTNLRGAQGAQGSAGTAGTAGAAGKTIVSGTVAPTTEGTDGDFYLDTATSTLYGPKAAGSWPAGTVLKGVSGYERRMTGPFVLSAFGSAASHSASCTAGKKVVGGGYEILGALAAAYPGYVYASNPNSSETDWDVLSSNISASDPSYYGSANIKVYAICVNA